LINTHHNNGQDPFEEEEEENNGAAPTKFSKKLASLSQALFPEIPEESKQRSVLGQFEPAYVASEFMLGFDYMCRVSIFLIIPALLCTILRRSVLSAHLLPLAGSKMKLLNKPVFLHVWESSFLEWIARRNFMPTPFAFRVIKPVEEEIFYRGIGYALYHLGNMCSLVVLGGAVRLSLGEIFLCWLLVNLPVQMVTFLAGSFDCDSFQQWFTGAVKLVAATLWLRAIFQLTEIKRKSVIHTRKDDEGADEKSVSSSSCQPNPPYYLKLAVAVATGKSTIPPLHFQKTVSQTLSLLTRLECSRQFGLAHCDPGPFWTDFGMKNAQKCIGTFFSSLLVESRLAVRRKNLWAPIGAHVAYNFVISYALALLYLRLGLGKFLLRCSYV